MLDADQGRILLQAARSAIAAEFGGPPPAALPVHWLQRPRASFVTLKIHGHLRGCIGSLEARRSLFEDVCHNAVAAAFRDPRFEPLTPAELEELRIEVSILSEATPMDCYDERDALAQLRPGTDGLILEYGLHRATFLPQVWDELPQPAVFLRQLKRKAGLASDFWSDDVRLARYTVQQFSEGE